MIKIYEAIAARRDKEEGSAFIFAVLLLMVMTLTVVLIASTAVTGARTASALTQRDLLRQAAEAGLNNALLQANQGGATILESRRGAGSAQVGVMSTATSTATNNDYGLRWSWYTQHVVLAGKQVGYYVYSTGYSSKAGVTDKVTLRSQFIYYTVNGATQNADGSFTYDYANPWEAGITGTTSVTIQNGAKIYVADSNYGSNATGTNTTGTVAATNNTMTINGTSTGLRQGSFTQNSGGCTGVGCTAPGFAKTYRDTNISLNSLNKPFQSGGQCAAGSYPIWKASENGGVLNLPSGTCVGGLIFDRDTTIPSSYSLTNPLVIYNAGNTVVYKGARVNTTQAPMVLQVYSGSGGLTVSDASQVYNSAVQTYAAMEFASASGSCQVAANTKYFGAVACANTTLATNTTFYSDQAVKDLLSIAPTGRKIWYMTYTEEL